MDKGRLIGIVSGFLLAIPAVILRLFFRFISLGSRVFSIKSRSRPACLSEPDLGVHKYSRTNGIKIHYVESGDSEKPLLLFVHGFPEFWFSWRSQIKHFKQNYRVVAMDTRGYNESDKPVGVDAYVMKNLIDDVKGLVEDLGVTKFTLVGHDWGGAIAWNFAAVYPDMLDNLIICNLPHVKALEDAWRSSYAQVLKSWYMLFFQCPVLPELFMLMEDLSVFNANMRDAKENDPEVLEAYKYVFGSFTAWNRTINYYRAGITEANIKFSASIASKLSNIKVPTLHIFGAGDKYLTLEAAKASSKYVDNYKLEVLEDVSHWVQQEAGTQVNTIMESFLSRKQ